MLSLRLVLLLALASFTANLACGQGPENTVVVVNADSPDSLAIANSYVHLRDIPAVNVIYLKGISRADGVVAETIYSSYFQRRILQPVFKEMARRRIDAQIDCVAYSSGFPTRSNFQPILDKYLRNTGKKYSPIQRNFASITSLTYFHRNAFSKRPDFLELDANHYANPQRMGIQSNPFAGEDAKMFDSAAKSMKLGDHDRAIEKLSGLARVHRSQVPVIYALARCYALKGEGKKAAIALAHAKRLGFASRSLISSDQAFASVAAEAEFSKVLSEIGDLPDGVSPSRSFSAGSYWAKNGWPSATTQQGDRYLLSAMLAVTGNNQSTLEASLARLQSSAAADGTNPRGNVYFAKHEDVRSKTRRTQFTPALKELRSLGHNATIGKSILPMNDPAVMGATLGSPNAKWQNSGSQFLPGAICDNLTSHGGEWEVERQTKLSQWLDAGAAGASGTVCEPYAMQAKFPTARWHAHYARGCTLAESFYQSVASPFQLLLVGDPLCCPFGKFPVFKVEGLSDNATVDRDFVLQIKPLPSSPKVLRYEIYYDGVFLSKISNPENVAVATDQMNDGYHELRIVGISDSSVACKTSKSMGVVVDREGRNLKITTPKSKVRLTGDLLVHAQYSGTGVFQIHQNYRAVGLIKNGSKTTISAAKLGLGLSQLQAVVALENGTVIRGKPVTVEVLP